MSITEHRAGALLGLATTAITALLFAVPAGSVAQAAPAPAPQHCIYNLDTDQQACFADTTQANAAITEQVSAQGKPEIIVGKFFEKKSFEGNSLTMYRQELCDGDDSDVDYTRNFHNDFVNSISSAQAWGNCKVVLHAKPDQKGDKRGPFGGDLTYVGNGMNNNAESVAFR